MPGGGISNVRPGLTRYLQDTAVGLQQQDKVTASQLSKSADLKEQATTGKFSRDKTLTKDPPKKSLMASRSLAGKR